MAKDRIDKKVEEVKDKESESVSKSSIFVKAKNVPVRIRQSPSIDSLPVPGKYLGDVATEVLEIVPGKGSKKGWGKLSNESGWVGMDFVEKVNK